ncbi:MAG: hypothetical protein HQK65_17310 [Desulfamplus sp.]|nr:hypothetical protein [Desulfamplus sp.]
MSRDINALIIFCEGPHDSAFVRMVLKKVMGYSIEKLKFSEMPSPFHKLFETSVRNHAAQDMSLDMAHKFFLPDTVLRKNDTIAFLFNCGGKTQYEKIRILLSSYIPLFSQAETFGQGAEEITQSVKYLFLYDADADGLERIISNLSKEFRTIDDDHFLNETWKTATSDFGRISADKAVFVWGGRSEQGTLEDALIPIFEFDIKNRALMEKARTTIDEMFIWETDHHDLARCVAETEKFNKAVLTTVGQREKPGSSLNVILEQSGLVTQEALDASEFVIEFVGFINAFLEGDRNNGQNGGI